MLYDAEGKEIQYTNDRDMNIVIANTLESLRSYFSTRMDKELTVETGFYPQVRECYRIWQQGGDNLVSSVLDMYVSSATNYGAIIHSDKKAGKIITDIFKYWKDYVVNSGMSLPTGLDSVYKEWIMESFGSRLCILYVVWDEVEIPAGSGKRYTVPVTMYVPNAYGIKVVGGNILGDHQYYFRTKEEMERSYLSTKFSYEDNYIEQYKNQDKQKQNDSKLPLNKSHSIYVRALGTRSYENYPIPFLFHRGTAQLIKVKEALRKSDYRTAIGIINDILMIKKGSDELTKLGITYGEKELTALKDLLRERLGTSQAFLTTYDTEMKHISPDTQSLLSREKYFEVDKDILASLGLINIRIEGERRESELNYKGFLLETQGVMKEFKDIMEKDLYMDFVRRNQDAHPELFKEFSRLLYIYKPINIWITDEGKRLIKNWYNSGLISKRNAIETTTDMNYDVEKIERQAESAAGDDDTMYPPIIQNQEEKGIDTQGNPPAKKADPNGRPEKAAIVTCGHCGYQLDTIKLPHIMQDAVLCPNCNYVIDIDGNIISTAEEYTAAPAWVENCVNSFMQSPSAKKKYPDAKKRKSHAWAVCTWQYKKVNKGKANGDSKA
jgi:hypothetical protein